MDAGAFAVTKRGYDPLYITEFSSALLDGFYLKEGETFDDALARTANAFSFGDAGLAQRIYEAVHDGWFMFASPILSNAPKGVWKGTPTDDEWKRATTTPAENSLVDKYWDGDRPRDMPISCYGSFVPDTIDGQIDLSSEVAGLSVAGGGVGLHNGIRGTAGKAPGPIPFMKTMDASIGYYRQGITRRGACAWYMDINHPDIMEHIKFRVPSGGDSARKSDNRKQFHSAVNITDEFIEAVNNDDDFDLVCPHSGKVFETVKARDLWEEVLETRALTGEPYILKIDTANRDLPETQKAKGLKIHGSNLCSEIVLPTDEDRTFVCCLSSLNLEMYDEWADTSLVKDLIVFLDNVIQYFIESAPPVLSKAVYSATQERAIGLGAMGWHYYLQKNMIPFEGGGFGSAMQKVNIIHKRIQEESIQSTSEMARTRGESPDMVGSGRRNSHMIAIAPNSNSSIILGTSPAIEPVSGNVFSHSTRAGTFIVKNPHLNDLLTEVWEDTLSESGASKEEWLNEVWLSIQRNNGSVQHLEYLTDLQKRVFKTAFEIDQHWVVEQADARQQYICQAQSVNLFFPAGVDRAYFNSVHLKALRAEHLKTLYYSRMERGVNADVVKEIERKAITDWIPLDESDDCVACQG